jgi:hypothetical protein
VRRSQRTKPRRTVPWLWCAAALIVLGGWVAGYVVWHNPDQDQFRAGVDVFFPLVMLVLGLPMVVAAGIALGGDGNASRWGGCTLLAVAALGLSYCASFAFFGGLCLDPGDVCVTSWPSRVANLATGLAILAVGWGVESRVPRGPRRRGPDVPEEITGP